MFTKKDAIKLVKNSEKLVITITGKRKWKVAIYIDGEERPFIQSAKQNIPDRKEAVMTVSSLFTWAESRYREITRDKTKREVFRSLIPKVKSGLELSDTVSTSKFE